MVGQKNGLQKIQHLLIQDGIAFEESVSAHRSNEIVLKTSGEVILYFVKGNNKIAKVGRFLTMMEFEK